MRHDIGMSGVYVLYRLYDSDGALLYVGVTDGFNGRMAHHKCKSGWWHLVTRTEVEFIFDRDAAAAAEIAAIETESPLCNQVVRSYETPAMRRQVDLPDVPDFLSAPEFARAMQVHLLTVHNWIADGRVKAMRPAGPRGRYRIPVSELERLAAQPA